MGVPDEAQSFVTAGCTGTCTQSTLNTLVGTEASAGWENAGANTAMFSSSGPFAIAFGIGDQFAFAIYNGDFVAWNWGAVVHTTLGNFTIPTASFAPGSHNVLLTSVFGNIGTITGVDVIVGGAVPVGGSDYAVNFQIAPTIPEPGTLLLIGSGLTGLALRRQRRS